MPPQYTGRDDVVTVFRGDAGPITGAIGRAIQSLSKFSGALKVSAAAAIGLGLAIKPSLDEAIRFQTELRELEKLLGQDAAAPLSRSILELSTRIPIARRQLMEVAATAARLGVRGRQNILDFTEVMAEIGVATDATAESAAENFARIAAVTRTPVSEIRNLANTANELSNTMGTSFREIMQSTGELAAVLKTLDIPTASIFGLAAALNEVNISISKGGRRLRSFFVQAVNPANFENLAAAINVTADEYKRLVLEAPIELLEKFIRVARGGGEAALDLTAALQQAGAQGILTLAQRGDSLLPVLEKASKEMESGNSLAEEAATFYNTAANKAVVLQNKLDALQIDIGRNFLPVWERVLEVTGKIIDGFRVLAGVSPLEQFGSREFAQQFRENIFEGMKREAESKTFQDRMKEVGEFLTTPIKEHLKNFDPELFAAADEEKRISALARRLHDSVREEFGEAVLEQSEKFSQGIISLQQAMDNIQGTWARLNAKARETDEIIEETTESPGGPSDLANDLNELEKQFLRNRFGADLLGKSIEQLTQEEADLLLELGLGTVELREGEEAARKLALSFQGISARIVDLVLKQEELNRQYDEWKETQEELVEFRDGLISSLTEEIALLDGTVRSTEEYEIKKSNLTDAEKEFLLLLVQQRDEWQRYNDQLEDAARITERLQRRMDNLKLLTVESRLRLLEDVVQDLSRSFMDMVEAMVTGSESVGDAMVNMINRIATRLAQSQIEGLLLGVLMPFIKNFAGGGTPSKPGNFWMDKPWLPAGRQHGGPVSPGNIYRVGEGGEEEFFVPNMAGRVVPKGQMGGQTQILVENRFEIRALDSRDVKQVLSQRDISDTIAKNTLKVFKNSELMRRGMV